MAKLNVFIDGSWLFKVCAPGHVLAARTENDNQGVVLDFARLDMILLDHATAHDPDCTELGERYLCTSVFTLPPDFDGWPDQYDGIRAEHVEQAKRNIYARNRFVKSATDAGYSDRGVYRPPIKPWILEKLIDKSKKYQEKLVDTTIVALLVRAAITAPGDDHCIITGDADLLPAVRLAHAEYSRNVFLATTHPDELKAEHRQSSYSLHNFDFRIPPVYLQDNVLEIVQGEYVSECYQCRRVFSRPYPPAIPSRPYCSACGARRS